MDINKAVIARNVETSMPTQLKKFWKTLLVIMN